MIEYTRNRMKNIESILNSYEKLKKHESIQGLDDCYMYSVNFKGLEVFLCELNSLISEEFNNVKKRHIVLPHSFELVCNNILNFSESKKKSIGLFINNKNFNGKSFDKIKLSRSFIN